MCPKEKSALSALLNNGMLCFMACTRSCGTPKNIKYLSNLHRDQQFKVPYKIFQSSRFCLVLFYPHSDNIVFFKLKNIFLLSWNLYRKSGAILREESYDNVKVITLFSQTYTTKSPKIATGYLLVFIQYSFFSGKLPLDVNEKDIPFKSAAVCVNKNVLFLCWLSPMDTEAWKSDEHMHGIITMVILKTKKFRCHAVTTCLCFLPSHEFFTFLNKHR